MGFLLGFPSLKLSHFHQVAYPAPLPTSLTVGSPIFLPEISSLKMIRLNTRQLSFIPQSHLYFGAIGANSQRSILISGVWDASKSWTQHLLSWFVGHPIRWFQHQIEIQHHPQKKATSLRLPAQVWKKVGPSHSTQIQRDRQRIRRAFSQPASFSPQKMECWKDPLKSYQVSSFASLRSLPNGHSYYHTGVDLRAKTGTPIPSMGSGKVLFAGQTVVGGKGVILSHGFDIFSRYLHLSQIDVKEGEEIPSGKVLGLSGATGRVEGPHLHWEILWKGTAVDPRQFLPAWGQICDQG